jgi:hypothetical protein
LNVGAPYGLGGVYDPIQSEAALRRYLAERVTILLGQGDVGSHNLATNDQAAQQGSTRLERGENAFREGERTAREHGWEFNWRLAMVPGVAHDAARMFTSEHMFAALQQ